MRVFSFSRLRLLFWNLIPALLTFVLLMVYLAPKHSDSLRAVMPMLHVGAMFYWAVTMPQVMPFLLVCALGLMVDVASGFPFGFTALLNMLLLIATKSQRKYFSGEGFLVQWAYFIIMSAAYIGANWLMVMVWVGESPSIGTSFAKWVMTLATYPFLYLIMFAIARLLESRRWQLLRS